MNQGDKGKLMYRELNEFLDVVLKNWFYNLKNGNINKEILILIYSGKADDLLKINPHIRFKVKSHLAHKNINYSVLNDNNFNQIIIIESIQEINIDLEKIDKKMIVVSSTHNFYKNPEEYSNAQYNNEMNLNENALNSLYIKKENIDELIQNSKQKDLYNLILKKLFILRNMYLNIDQIVMQNIQMGNSFNENLSGDIEMLNRHEILTARLAVIIYRVFSLKINANITEIGRKINLITGAKSKTFTPKMIVNLLNHQKTFLSPDLIKKKSFKAYNLNVNELEHKIRIEIANELLSFNPKELSFDLISKATKLPIETIKKLDTKFI